jgi:hypothetical protein
MKAIRKYLVFGASLALALGIGFAMQSTTAPNHPAFVLRALEADDPEVRLAAAQTAREADLMRSINARPVTPVAAEVDAGGETRSTLPVVELPADFLKQDAPAAAGAPVSDDPAILARADPTVTVACARSITLLAQPAALLQLTVDAPCDADARVVIRHAGLAITERFSSAGILDVLLPAFSDIAEVSVVFIDGKTLDARTMVPDIELYDRVAVQWQSPDSFQLHAFEFGAEFDSPGHVSAASPRDPGFALRATGGFLLLLGDSSVTWPLLAEVYTFPSARVPRSGTVTIEIEAMVTPEVCGREILGETIEIHAGTSVVVRELTVSMPGCEAEGQFIVLKNALEDLTIAAN